MRTLPKVFMIGMVSLLPWQALAADATAPADAKGGAAAGMTKLDANNDGVVTHEEFISGSEARFKLMDTNGDGKITKEEYTAFTKSLREHQKAMREQRKKDAAASGVPVGSGHGKRKSEMLKAKAAQAPAAAPATGK